MSTGDVAVTQRLVMAYMPRREFAIFNKKDFHSEGNEGYCKKCNGKKQCHKPCFHE